MFLKRVFLKHREQSMLNGLLQRCSQSFMISDELIYGIGGDHERAHGSIRFTFGRFNKMGEVDRVVSILAEIIRELRSISGRASPAESNPSSTILRAAVSGSIEKPLTR